MFSKSSKYLNESFAMLPALENTIQNLMHNIHSKCRMIKSYVKHNI